MKRFLIISYWVVSILLVAVVLTSIGYRFLEALFIGSMFLPGALAAKYFFPKVRGVKDTVFLVLGILMAEILLFLIAHYLILTYRENLPLPMWDWPDLPQILTNPVFIALILTTLAAGSYFFESWLDRKRPTRPAPTGAYHVHIGPEAGNAPAGGNPVCGIQRRHHHRHRDRRPPLPEQDSHLPVGSHPQPPFSPDSPFISCQ